LPYNYLSVWNGSGSAFATLTPGWQPIAYDYPVYSDVTSLIAAYNNAKANLYDVLDSDWLAAKLGTAYDTLLSYLTPVISDANAANVRSFTLPTGKQVVTGYEDKIHTVLELNNQYVNDLDDVHFTIQKGARLDVNASISIGSVTVEKGGTLDLRNADLSKVKIGKLVYEDEADFDWPAGTTDAQKKAFLGAKDVETPVLAFAPYHLSPTSTSYTITEDFEGAASYAIFVGGVKVSEEKTYVATGQVTGQAYSSYAEAYDADGKVIAKSKTYNWLARPQRPATLSLTAGSKSITATWAAEDECDGYALYISTSATGAFTKVATIPGKASTTYTIKGLTSGTTYYVKVVSYTQVTGYKVPSEYTGTPYIAAN